MNGVKLENKELLMKDLEDGDLAVITAYGEYKDVVIHIIRSEDINWAIAIGRSYGDRWTNIDFNKLTVRRLEPGEKLIVS
jgi:hypothetical protein